MSTTYIQDVKFLKKFADIVELSPSDGAKVAVAPAFQGRVMTSSLAGDDGGSFGWLNVKFIESGREDKRFNNYGGEDRFWLGPEAGQFGLWFKTGEPFDLAHWTTPEGFNAGKFAVTSQGKTSVAMATEFKVANASGTTFDCAVKRTVAALSAAETAGALGGAIPAGVSAVAYESRNTLANAGKKAWTRDGGLLSIWILGQYKPLPRGRVIVPFVAGDEKTLGVKATTNYFGEIPSDRCRVAENFLLFACDGKFRSKIGVSPARARDVLGSYDADAKTLTIVQLNLPADAAKRPYVNSLWETQSKPFAGDAVNSYNDGEATPGAGQLGPFYEIETSSPAAELAPGEALTHTHRTMHFSGDFDALNQIAKKVLGVDLSEVK
jgi:hypothetical protein